MKHIYVYIYIIQIIYTITGNILSSIKELFYKSSDVNAYPDIITKEMFYSIRTASLTPSEYQNKLNLARYCLILKGDTSSSKR
jgi:hypothetical protein